MFWNEKIDIIQQTYSKDEFSVPTIGRKKILRTIESKFIVRPESYYDSNEFLDVFMHWWRYFNKNYETITSYHFDDFFDRILHPQHHYWIAYELGGSVMIYKATPKVIKHLTEIGRTWTNTLYVCHLKYDYIIGLNIRHDGSHIIYAGNEKMKTRLSQLPKADSL